MVNIKINNKELSVNKDLTILQAASLADIQIPRFCYHEKLTIAGNCRMCLVEMSKVAKPVASCALPVSEGMQVYTNSIIVKKAREGVLELLLANHPLDCPICDQGGECDLQEQAMIFGNDRSRFYEIKRAVSDKTISPFVKTIMTRCIHCTRCVRFLAEVAGVNELGVTGRGSSSEIGTYVKNSISSELSGNIIDLCPVGALTSKPYAFTARPWELRSTETLDVFDSLGANIKVDVRGPNLMRILPKANDSINEEWITDKTRFSFDGYKAQRLSAPMYSQKLTYLFSFANFKIEQKTKTFLNCGWPEAFLIFKEFSSFYEQKNIIIGNQVNLESLVFLKQIKRSLKFTNIFNQYHFDFSLTSPNSSLDQNVQAHNFTARNEIKVKDIEKSDVCLLIGTNLRLENPLINSRLRKAFLNNNTQIVSVGPSTNALYNHRKLGNSTQTLLKIIEGKHSFNGALSTSKNPIIIIGRFSPFYSLLPMLRSAIDRKKTKVQFYVINPFISNVMQDKLNISSSSSKSFDNDNACFNFFIQADESSMKINKLKCYNNFTVYAGFQADRTAMESDLILPTASHLEEISTYLDGDQTLRKTDICLPAPVGCRTSWKILAALLVFYGRDKSIIIQNVLDNKNSSFKLLSPFVVVDLEIKPLESFQQIPNIVNSNFITNYYKTNSVTRNSRVMSQMTKQKVNGLRF